MSKIADTLISVNDFNSRNKFENIVDKIGEPIFRGESFAIYNGDCLELLSKLPDSCIDLTFTSPPYNIGKEYEKILPIDDYVNWCLKWISVIHKKTQKRGAFVLNVGYFSIPNFGKNIPIPYLLWDKTPFFLQQEIVWNYGAGVAAKKFLSPRNEKLLWYIKDSENYCFNLDDIRDPDVAYPNQKKNGKLRCNTIGKNPSDVWQIAKVTSGANRSSSERTSHPAQFPLDLCERVIKGFSDVDSIIIDPFLGSGSTIEAGLRWKRYSIGFEINKEYCEIAYKRAKEFSKNMELFFSY